MQHPEALHRVQLLAIRNRALGRNTWVYIDEIYLLFQHEYSANFLFTLWKRVRKYGACCTGLTQNVLKFQMLVSLRILLPSILTF